MSADEMKAILARKLEEVKAEKDKITARKEKYKEREAKQRHRVELLQERIKVVVGKEEAVSKCEEELGVLKDALDQQQEQLTVTRQALDKERQELEDTIASRLEDGIREIRESYEQKAASLEEQRASLEQAAALAREQAQNEVQEQKDALTDAQTALAAREEALTSEYEAKQRKLSDMKAKLQRALVSLRKEKDALLSSQKAQTTQAAELLRLEDTLAQRESSLGARETEVAAKERSVAQREATLRAENQMDRYTRMMGGGGGGGGGGDAGGSGDGSGDCSSGDGSVHTDTMRNVSSLGQPGGKGHERTSEPQLETLKERYRALLEQHAASQRKTASLQMQNAQISEVRQALQRDLSAVETRLRDSVSSLELQRSTVTRLTRQCAQLRLSEQQARVTADKNAEALRRDKAAMSAECGRLEERVKSLEAELSAQKQAAARLKQESAAAAGQGGGSVGGESTTGSTVGGSNTGSGQGVVPQDSTSSPPSTTRTRTATRTASASANEPDGAQDRRDRPEPRPSESVVMQHMAVQLTQERERTQTLEARVVKLIGETERLKGKLERYARFVGSEQAESKERLPSGAVGSGEAKGSRAKSDNSNIQTQVEYSKNIAINYLGTHDFRLFPVLCRVLALTRKDVDRILTQRKRHGLPANVHKDVGPKASGDAGCVMM